MKLGNKNISKIYLGDKAINRIYLGSKVVFGTKPTGRYKINSEYVKTKGTPVFDSVSGIGSGFSKGNYYYIDNYRDDATSATYIVDFTTAPQWAGDDFILEVDNTFSMQTTGSTLGFYTFYPANWSTHGELELNTRYRMKVENKNNQTLLYMWDFNTSSWNLLTYKTNWNTGRNMSKVINFMQQHGGGVGSGHSLNMVDSKIISTTGGSELPLVLLDTSLLPEPVQWTIASPYVMDGEEYSSTRRLNIYEPKITDLISLGNVDIQLTATLPIDSSKPVVVTDPRDNSTVSLFAGQSATYESSTWRVKVTRTGAFSIEARSTQI